MVSCFDFFLSLNFGKMAKRFVWRTDKPQADLPQTPNSQVRIVSRDLPRGGNY
ncbi:hypothetical protein AAZX31_09G209500 [Glycine max]|uniref:Protein PROPEP890 n=3 Tax=Glycine subgen. Soja TaxID=1462606 RepID=PP890_SOYBN|nr:RecName: Full=Protein PROPEP890; Short=GmPROPEP890; Contains: RecName: Full=Peptide GmPep890; Flags: Precursor [Glycine max]KAG4992423.1 hypothetical protein JHK87_025880 [Glycine soja]KAG5008005.1 hypothetical protein JHK85_026547 [Glycine max]KAG5013805.1 hypothetical protein JHK86_026066 [Glycine max]KAG5134751.1 hypothetical protein JHK82_025939 [Glycine max]KAH1044370.1 hypothetical protein GYH30_025908 [Glycine max]